jgi:hypothetical protein
MAKFKVGDRVRVREDLKAGVYKCNKPDCCIGGIGTTENMVKFAGRICTIHELATHDNYYLVGCGGNIFTDDMLDDQVVFTKADLKDGMVVENRRGNRYIILNNKLIRRGGSIWFSDIKDDLTDKDLPDTYSIDKVYKSTAVDLKHLFEDNSLELIWERKKEEPVKEMTVEEIEKILGHKVKVIADEK